MFKWKNASTFGYDKQACSGNILYSVTCCTIHLFPYCVFKPGWFNLQMCLWRYVKEFLSCLFSICAGGSGDGQRGLLSGVCTAIRGEAQVLQGPEDDVPI